MKDYKRMLKLRLLAAFNIFNDDLINSNNEEFDCEISYSVDNHNKTETEFLAFCFLFRCENSYEIAAQKLNIAFEKDYSVDLVKKYGKRAINRLIKQCQNDKRLKAWIIRNKNYESKEENNETG